MPGRIATRARYARRAAIRQTIGNAYEGLGLYKEARKQLEPALELSRRNSGPAAPKTLTIMADLAFVIERQGKYPEAERLLAQALGADRRVLGPESPQTLQAMNRLVWSIRQKGDIRRLKHF
jgi:tetratricopeptide (TPR) repeat protein